MVLKGKPRKLIKGVNDLATTHPEIAKQADGWDPALFVAGSAVKKPWICQKGHKWEYEIRERTRTGRTGNCFTCTGEKLLSGFNDLATTHPELAKEAVGWDTTAFTSGSVEKLLWKCSLGHHWEATIHARARVNHGCPICSGNTVLAGFNDLAFKFPDIAKEANKWDPTTLTWGAKKKVSWKCSNGHTYEASVSSRTRKGKGTGCGICANQETLVGFNDLATTHPELAKEAFGWDPTELTAGSAEKRQWRCSLGHTWEAIVGSRGRLGRGCPVCSNNRVLAGFNDLATTHPDIAKQAVGWDTKTVTAGSEKKLRWECELGHEWDASVKHRALNERGCPSCAKYGYSPNEDGYLYFLAHSNWEMLQIGITNFPDQRLESHKHLGWEVIELRGPMDGLLTRGWETSILQMLKKRGAKLAPDDVAGKFDGYTEAWMQSSLPVKSIKELMRMVEEMEEE